MKTKIFFILTFISLKGFSQSNNVQTAGNFYKGNEIEKAKSYIDMASTNESTSNDPKMWYYRGKIYLAIHNDPALQKLDPDAAEKSAISFISCLKADKKEFYKDECLDLVWVVGIGVFNKAVEAYNSNDLERAQRFYKLVFDIIPLDKDNNLKRNNITADILNKNLYAAARKAKDNEKAKLYLQNLMDAKYNDPMIYIYMSKIYLEEKDTAKGLSYIEKGRNLFDENTNLINEEIAIYLAQGKTDVLIAKLSDAIEKNPDNEVLYYIRGNLYDNRKENTKAEADYKKAIELKPDYFDPCYNLGAMYFNQGAEIYNVTSKLPPSKAKEYAEGQKKYKEMFKSAQPYFEKALQANPKDKTTMLSLRELYAKTDQLDKAGEMAKKLEGQK